MKIKTLVTALCGATLALPASAVVNFADSSPRVINQGSVTRDFNPLGEENFVFWNFNLSGIDAQVETATLVLQSTALLAISDGFDVLLRTRPERVFGSQEPSFLFLEVFPTQRADYTFPLGDSQTIEFEFVLSDFALAELQKAIDSEFVTTPGEAALIAAPELELAIFNSPESFLDSAQLRLEFSPVPEPSTTILGLLASTLLFRRRR